MIRRLSNRIRPSAAEGALPLKILMKMIFLNPLTLLVFNVGLEGVVVSGENSRRGTAAILRLVSQQIVHDTTPESI